MSNRSISYEYQNRKILVHRDNYRWCFSLYILIGSLNSSDTAFQLSRYLNQKLYDSKRVINSFVGDDHSLQISNKCSVLECYKTIKNCDTTGLICQCCDIITCKPNFPAAKTMINGKPKLNSYLSQEDKNLILLSRVSFFYCALIKKFQLE